jgi:hypothetical protein
MNYNDKLLISGGIKNKVLVLHMLIHIYKNICTFRLRQRFSMEWMRQKNTPIIPGKWVAIWFTIFQTRSQGGGWGLKNLKRH